MQAPACTPPPPLPVCSPPLRLPMGAPPCHLCQVAPASVRNRGALGGARKVRPPVPLVTAPAHAHRLRARDPAHPPHSSVPAPVYAQRRTGDALPNPSPPFSTPPRPLPSPHSQENGVGWGVGPTRGRMPPLFRTPPPHLCAPPGFPGWDVTGRSGEGHT